MVAGCIAQVVTRIFAIYLHIVTEKEIVYANGATMQSMLDNKNGRGLIIEPGIGYREEKQKYSLITNYSLLAPESTRPHIVSWDNRYERAKKLLEEFDNCFSYREAFSVLKVVCQEGERATRVSFVYSVNQQKVYYVLNNSFDNIKK